MLLRITPLIVSAFLFTGCAADPTEFADTGDFDTGWAEFESSTGLDEASNKDGDIHSFDALSEDEIREDRPEFNEEEGLADTVDEDPIDDLDIR